MKEAADVLAGCVCGFTTRMFVAPLGTWKKITLLDGIR